MPRRIGASRVHQLSPSQPSEIVLQRANPLHRVLIPHTHAAVHAIRRQLRANGIPAERTNLISEYSKQCYRNLTYRTLVQIRFVYQCTDNFVDFCVDLNSPQSDVSIDSSGRNDIFTVPIHEKREKLRRTLVPRNPSN